MKSFQNFFNEYTKYITPSEIIEFTYCKRFSYFMHCLKLKQHEEKRYKVQMGRNLHKTRAEHNKSYIRKRFADSEKIIDVDLFSKKYNIRGKVDELYLLNDKTAVIIDYKYAEYDGKIYKTHKVQMIMYAVMIEEVFDYECNLGCLVFCRGANKLVDIEIKPEDKNDLVNILDEYLEVINGKFPSATKHKSSCLDCCYSNICIK